MTKPRTATDPPSYLERPERDLWTRLIQEYALADTPALVLLQQLCRSLGLVRRCREQIAADGLTVDGKPHGLLSPMRDAERQAASALRHLNFDLGPLRDAPGRPPGS